MSIIVCGAAPDSDGIAEIVAALRGLSRSPGWRMRLHPNHIPTIDRNECEAYVPGCSCGETGQDTADLEAATRWWGTHLDELSMPSAEKRNR